MHRRILFFILLSVLLGGCCEQRFLKQYDQIKMKSDHVILEARGDTVPFHIRIEIPPRTLCGNLELRLTPCLKKDSLKSPADLIRITAQKADSGVIRIKAKKGGCVDIDGYFMNFKQLQDALFVIEWSAVNGDKEANFSDRLLGYGISQIYHYGATSGLHQDSDVYQLKSQLEEKSELRADEHYLLAALSARVFDAKAVESHLLQALKMKPALQQRINTDIEFIGYRKTEWFQKLPDAIR